MGKEKSVLVTGCSSGIGYGVVKKFINEGYLVFGTVRKKRDEERLKKELGEQFVPVQMDVTDAKSIREAAKSVSKILGGKGLSGLINNAGTVSPGPIVHMKMSEIKSMFEVNTYGPLEVARAFLPLLGFRKNHASDPGRIVNISSGSGQIAVPFLGAYSGTKHALEGIMNTLRQEVKPYGIEVVTVAPGFVNSSIGDKLADVSPYAKTDYINSLKKFSDTTLVQLEKEGHTIDEQAGLIFRIFNRKNPSARYSTARNKFKNWIMLKYTPGKIREKLVAKIFGLGS